MNAVRSFEQLEVFQRAYRISLDIHRVSLKFPREEQRGLGEQVRRASKSICANVAEGFGKQSQSVAEFRRFLRIAMGSADEMRVWLALLSRPRLHRRDDVAGMARRVSSDRAHAAGTVKEVRTDGFV